MTVHASTCREGGVHKSSSLVNPHHFQLECLLQKPPQGFIPKTSSLIYYHFFFKGLVFHFCSVETFKNSAWKRRLQQDRVCCCRHASSLNYLAARGWRTSLNVSIQQSLFIQIPRLLQKPLFQLLFTLQPKTLSNSSCFQSRRELCFSHV